MGREDESVYVVAERACPICEHPGPHHVDLIEPYSFDRGPTVYCTNCWIRFTDRPAPEVIHTGIEYTDAVQRIHGAELLTHTSWFDGLGRFSPESFYARDRWTMKYAWAIPSPPALDRLVQLSPIVEMGAGTGYWAHLLRERGATVHAYDAWPPDGGEWPRREDGELLVAKSEEVGVNWYHRGQRTWTEVLPGKPPVLKEYGPPWTLLLSWPPYSDPMGMEAVGWFPGNTIALIGEGQGGCTGTNRMWRLLHRFFEETEEIHIPQWPGMHDYLSIWVRKRSRLRALPRVATT